MTVRDLCDNGILAWSGQQGDVLRRLAAGESVTDRQKAAGG
jgi:hypothetical protein